MESFVYLPQITQIFLDFCHFFAFGSKTIGSDLTIFRFSQILFCLGIKTLLITKFAPCYARNARWIYTDYHRCFIS